MQQLRFVSSPPDALFAVQALQQHPDGVSGRMQLDAWALGPDGEVALGSLGVLADNVLGYALMASLPQGSWSISTEIWLDLVGRLPGPGATVTARSRPVRGVPAGATVRFAAATPFEGRSLVVTDVTGSVEGRTCTVATVTANGSVAARV